MSDQFTNRVNSLAQAWLAWMWEMAWQVTILVALLAVVTWLLRHRSARLRYALWMLVPVRLIVPPTFAFVTGWGWWMLPPTDEMGIANSAFVAFIDVGNDGENASGGAAGGAINSDATPGPEGDDVMSGDVAGSDTAALRKITNLDPKAERSQTIVTADTEQPDIEMVPAVSLSWKSWVMGAWVSVVLFLSMFMAWGAWIASRLVRQANVLRAGLLFEAVETCRTRLGVRERILIREADASSVPMLIGVVRQSILVPAGIEQKLSAAELEAVLAHELQHVARRDTLVNLAQAVTGVIYFFHPLVWVANRGIRRLREDACDEATVAALNGVRRDYGTAILKIAQSGTAHTPHLALAVVETGRSVKRRLRRILDPKLPIGRRLSWSAIGVILLVAAVLLPAAAPPTDDVRKIEDLAAEPGERFINAAAPATVASAQSDEQTVAAPDSKDSTFQVRGQVFGPAGKPLVGADVYIGLGDYGTDSTGIRVADPMHLQTNVDGWFEASCPLSRFVEDSSAVPGMFWQFVRPSLCVAATMDGLGPAWIQWNEIPKGGPLLLKLVEDRPIEGRIISIDGTPVPNARLKLESIERAPQEGIDPWIASLRSGESLWRANAVHGLQRVAPNVIRIPSQFVTDQDGRIKIAGLGRDRLARLIVDGPAVARRIVRLITRDIDPLPTNLRPDVQALDSDKIFAANFEVIVAPSQPIIGVVRDALTRQPLPRVAIESYRFAGSNVIGNRTNVLTVYSDERGHFRLEGMPKGDGNRLLAVPNDEQPYFMREIRVPEAPGFDPIEVGVELHRGVWVEGKVIVKTSRDPVYATLHYLPMLSNPHAAKLPEFTTLGNGFVDGGTGHQHRYSTKADGSFRLVGLPGAGVVGAVTADHFRRGAGADRIGGFDENGRLPTYHNPLQASREWPNVMVPIDPAEGVDSINVLLEAQSGASVRVRVRDSAQKPLTAYRVLGHDAGSFFSDPIPNAAFDAVAISPGKSRTLLIHHPERNLGLAFRIKHGEELPAENIVMLEPCATVRGRLVDANGDPIPRATLKALTLPAEDFNPALPEIATDQEGRFEFASALPGTEYTVQVTTQRDGQTSDVFRFSPKKGEVLTLGNVIVQP